MTTPWSLLAHDEGFPNDKAMFTFFASRGLTDTCLAEYLNLRPRTVYTRRHRHGIQSRHRTTAQARANLLSCDTSRMTLHDIANRMNVTTKWAESFCRYHHKLYKAKHGGFRVRKSVIAIDVITGEIITGSNINPELAGLLRHAMKSALSSAVNIRRIV